MKKLLLLLIIIISLSVKANDNVTIDWWDGTTTTFRAKYFWTDFDYKYPYLEYNGYMECGDFGGGGNYVCFYDHTLDRSQDREDWISDYENLEKKIKEKGKYTHLVIHRDEIDEDNRCYYS